MNFYKSNRHFYFIESNNVDKIQFEPKILYKFSPNLIIKKDIVLFYK